MLVDGWIVEADEDVVRCGVWRGLGGGGSLELSVVLLGPRSIPCFLLAHPNYRNRSREIIEILSSKGCSAVAAYSA